VKRSPASRPTLKSIAAKAGLSGAAVSLALRDHPSIAPRTRARVQRLAARLGYRADPTVTRLMTYLRQRRGVRATGALGLLTMFPQAAPWLGNAFLRRIHTAAEARAHQFGYQLEEFWLAAPGMTPARLRDILLARGIEGLLVLGQPPGLAPVPFDFARFACGAIGYSLETPLHRACQHQYQEMFTALGRLAALGYERPGLVLPEDSDARTRRHWSAAFLAAQQRWPAARRVPPLIAPRIDGAIFGRWFRAHRPDAVIAQSPGAAEYLRWLRDAGARVPADCGFADLDVEPTPGDACSGIRQNYEQVASAAVDLVVSQIQRNERGIPAHPKVVLIEGEWIDGGTTRAPRA
jgi:LacI family transcriptional regulator